MANDNNIKTFTATDLERYHKGQLSAKEMHALEKAALDDPFLADALEGYSIQGVKVSDDIAELKKRLAEKTEQAQVIPIATAGSPSFPWLRAAVVVVMVAGAGLLAYQFLFNTNKKGDIAQAPTEKNKSQESSPIVQPPTANDSTLNYLARKKMSDDKAATEAGTKQQRNSATYSDADNISVADSTAIRPDVISNSAKTAAPAKLQEEKEYKQIENLVRQTRDSTGKKGDVALKEVSGNVALNKPAAADKDGDGVIDAFYYKAKSERDDNGLASKRAESAYRAPNVFRGRVTDASNSPLPFANITNRRDNVGTYSDAQGNFTLVSPDTVMDVQVRSLGFENSNVQLKRLMPGNQIVMQEDRSLDARVLDTVKHNISRARGKTMTFEEPEPEDGWPAYNSYVLNNLNMPEKIDMKKSDETGDNTVEVSFEVSKNGDPVNIKVEKSLCDKCDKEAVRLIKDGPKWKRMGKKGKRTTVTVPFIKTN